MELAVPSAKAASALAGKAYVAASTSRAYALSFALENFVRLLGLERHTRTRAETWAVLRPAIQALFEQDWADAAAGYYPFALLPGPLREYAGSAVKLLADIPRSARRIRARRTDDLDAESLRGRYPKYYLRNFHYQSEGYLGHTSAALYDLQVEVLFWGTADAMRRRLIPPIVDFARRRAKPLRILDVACGTGHFLRMLATALPEAEITGLDMSPHYIARARALMPRDLCVSLLVDDAERLPFLDGHFDVVTNIYLMHELPPKVRPRVLAELARVTRPGGLVLVADSVEYARAPELRPELESFPRMYHEPFFVSYAKEHLSERVAATGLAVRGTSRFHLTQIVSARKPGAEA